MQSHHSRLAKQASIRRSVSVLTTLTAGLFCGLCALGVVSPGTAAAQGPQTLVNFTYLKYNGESPSSVETQPSGFNGDIIPSNFPVAFVSVTASFTGHGYGFPLSSFSSLVETEAEEAQVEDGDAFIVTPIIDPDLYVSYEIHNETGQVLTSLTFTLQPAADLYFFGSSFISGAALSNYSLSDQLGSFDDGSGSGTFRNGYQSLTFSAPRGGIADGDFNTFNFSLHIPDGQPGQRFGAVLSPNGFTPLAFPNTGAPEPGSLMLLLPVGMLLGAAARAKRRARTSQT